MGAQHSHEHGHHAHGHGPDRSGSRRALAWVFLLTTVFMVVEVVGGLVTGSLALIADAAHMLSDSVSIGLALLAVWLASRPPTMRRTFGFQRAEILAALFNGLALVGVSIWILVEAYGRFGDPPEILGGPMLIVAFVGLAVNVTAVLILHRGGDDSLNVSAALRHVIADLLGSVGVIVAAVVILLTGWEEVDAIVSVAIAVLILGSSWTILRDSTEILLEATPRGLDLAELGNAMLEVDGVVEVHDLHAWTITSGFPALAAHVLVAEGHDCHAARRELAELLSERFGVDHTTLQVEHPAPELLQIEGLSR